MSKAHQARPLSGILLLDKPTRMSSNHALQKAKCLFHAQKAGHTGALDPLATGLLPICFGEATKFTQFLLDADKAYQATAHLGVRTDTADADGQVLANLPYSQVTKATIKQVLLSLKGSIMQVPPIYSALKFQGKPLYKYARAGQQVPIQPRPVKVYEIECSGYNAPELGLSITCSKGTYIRSLVEDLGLALGCGAHVSALRRTQAGPFVAEHMVTFDTLASKVESSSSQVEAFSRLDALLLPPDTAVLHLNAVQLCPQQVEALQQGKQVDLQTSLQASSWLTQTDLSTALLVRVYDLDQAFIGIAQVTADYILQAKRLLQCN